MVIQERVYSADEFWELSRQPEYADRHLELIEGEIYPMTPAGGEHGEVTFDFSLRIGSFVKSNRLGRVTAAETGYVLFRNPDGKDTVRAPDIGFVSISRAPEPLSEQFVPFAPDLAVEVISPSDRADEVEAKVLQYLRAGVRLIWLVYPASRTIVVHSPNRIHRLTIDDTLDGGDVLPGFQVKINDIFPS